jgi:phosphoribosylglycinamide formyltransferase
MIKILVIISGNGTNLKALIAAQNNVLKSGVIVQVISSSPTAGGILVAEKNHIGCLILDRKNILCDEFEFYVSKKIMEENIDLIVLDGFIYILSNKFVKQHERKIINIHPSLLPKYGGKGMFGLRVHEEVLKHGDTESGATVHYVSEEVDCGEIIMQEKIAVLPTDTAESLQQRILSTVEWKLYPLAVEQVCQNLMREG